MLSAANGDMDGTDLTRAVFEPLVGTVFTIGLDDGSEYPLTLEACILAEAPAGAMRAEPFTLLFLGPPGGHLPQHTARLAHPVLHELEIFVVPLGPRPGDGAQQYEAVFN